MKILFVHHNLSIIAGGELFTIYGIDEMLKDPTNEISLLSLYPPDYDEIERITGIRLPADKIRFILASCPKTLRNEKRLGNWLMAFLQRHAQKIARNFDVCINGFNEMDFGVRGMQYLHFPSYAPRELLGRYQMVPPDSLSHRFPKLMKLYAFITHRIGRTNHARMMKNHSWVNSYFMQGVVQEAYGIKADVFYSAFVDPPEKWNKARLRENRVITVGRFRADKSLLEYVDFCAALHRQHPDLTFMIVGKPVDRPYYESVVAKIQELGVPMELKTECSKEELAELLETSRYYLHPKPVEHFGISVLESLCAGCLPFVHQSGGVIEIVPLEELQFQNEADLLAKFSRIHRDEELRTDLLKQLAEHGAQFSTENFRRKFRADVAAFVK